MATPYLPAGWTEEMLVTATEEQWNALTDDEYQKVSERRLQDSLAIAAANQVEIAAQAEEKGLTIGHPNLANFAEVIFREKLQEWGFIVIRTNYDNDAEWAQFRKLWDESMDDQMRPEEGEGIEQVRGNLKFEWVEDKPSLDGKDLSTIRTYFHNWVAGRELPRGVIQDVCLVVTSEALQSQLHGSTSATFNYASPNRPNAPFVTALDPYFDPEDVDDEEYAGYFKVAISSLLNEFFPVLAGPNLTLEELKPSFEEGEIWFSAS